MTDGPTPKTPESIQFPKSGNVPNHPKLPLLIYRKALDPLHADLASVFESMFTKNGWKETWRNGVYPFRHYHSNAHETLAVCSGHATLELGGASGGRFEVDKGDVVVLPAGCGHMLLNSSGGFQVVGTYPDGASYDLIREEQMLTEGILKRIESVPLPCFDPIFGKQGPLVSLWKAALSG